MVPETSWWPYSDACSSICWPLDGSRKPVGFSQQVVLFNLALLDMCPSASVSNRTCHRFMDGSEERMSEMKTQQSTLEKWSSQGTVAVLEVTFSAPYLWPNLCREPPM